MLNGIYNPIYVNINNKLENLALFVNRINAQTSNLIIHVRVVVGSLLSD